MVFDSFLSAIRPETRKEKSKYPVNQNKPKVATNKKKLCHCISGDEFISNGYKFFINPVH